MKEIKSAWNKLFFSSSPEESRILTSELIASRRQTALDSLATRYRRFAILGGIMILCSITWLGTPMFPEDKRWLICTFFAIYFATASIMDIWLYHGIRSIDIYTMPVEEVATKALFYRRRHLQFIVILLPMAFGTIGYLAYTFLHEPYMIAGIICGALLGLVLGTNQLLNFLREYRDISQ